VTSSSAGLAAARTSNADQEPLGGKVALVTGGGRGIGRAVATRLATLGADIGLVQRSDAAETAAEVRRRGRKVFVVRADLGDAAAGEHAVAAVVSDLGRLDVAVCNAGMVVRAPALELSLDDWQRVLDVNLTGAFVVSRAAARQFVAQGGGGRIVHIASVMSFHAGVNTSAYAASKGGIAQLTKAQANEWAPLGIRVNAVAPGWVETELTEPLREDERRFAEISARIPVGRWATADDIAGAVAFLSLPESEYVNGVVMPVDGGWLAR
jgi:2-dehydro-3-deoxy-D-gluconate 5-dehydrogenase